MFKRDCMINYNQKNYNKEQIKGRQNTIIKPKRRQNTIIKPKRIIIKPKRRQNTIIVYKKEFRQDNVCT